MTAYAHDMRIRTPRRCRTVSERTIAVRQQLLTLLRAAHRPLSTPEICRQIADGGRNCKHPQSRPGGGVCPDRWDGPYWCRAACRHQPVYAQMRVLETLGLVERVQYPNRDSIAEAVAAGSVYEHITEHSGSRAVYWRYIDTESDAYFNAILDMQDRA